MGTYAAQNNEEVNWPKWVYSGLIVLLTLLVYLPSLHNGFVTFDDPGYITGNRAIRNISRQGLKIIFSSFVLGNYHPFVVLCDALLYHFFGLNPFPYHTFSLFLHLLNILLVFELIYRLTGKNTGVAAFVAVLFAIQPMHVEAVCWASDLKDLLYTFFFLASLIYYTQYTNSGRYKFLFVSGLLFIGALFSKSAAVTLPVILLLIDYYYDRKFTKKTIIEKVPLFLLSIVFGLVNIYSQKSAGAFTDVSSYNIFDRICIPAYNLVYYLVTLFWPFNFAVIHPLPEKLNNQLPWEYYLSPLVLLAFICLVIWVVIKYPAYRKIIVFGLLFFLLTISLVIQIKPIGQSVISERYTYLPYIGLFFVIAMFYEGYLKGHPKLKSAMGLCFGAVVLVFSFMAYQRTMAWDGGINLLNDEINKYPVYYKGYEWRGEEEKDSADMLNAIIDFTKAIELNPKYEEAYNNRGICEYYQRNYNGALSDYARAIELAPARAEFYVNTGLVKQAQSDYTSARVYFNKAIELDSQFAMAYYNRAINDKYLKDYGNALNDYNKAIELNPDFTEAYDNRAELRGMMKDYQGALDDYNKAISLNPGVAQEYNNRGEVRRYLGDMQGALADFNMSIEIRPDAEAYYDRGNVKFKLNDMNGAIDDYGKAVNINASYSDAYLNRGLARFNLQDKAGACNDWHTAQGLGNDAANQYLQTYCR